MKHIVVLLIFANALVAHAQQSQDTVSFRTFDKKKFNTLVVVSATAYVGGMIGLNQLWYENQQRQQFQFFNDNAEWNQVDKLGHFYSAFQLSHIAQRAFLWTGVPEKKANLIGALTGFALVAPIELFDGYSEAYGASTGDLIADAAGSVFFYGQQALWNEVRIHPKFSYHHSDYAALRSDILGNTTSSRILKDYNGQTHWLSFDIDKFAPSFPRWLNVAVGYGAEQMIYGRDHQNHVYGLYPYRQFYLAIDPDLTAIRSRNKTVRTLLFLANMIKLPAPTLEWSQKKVHFHGFYF